MLLTNPLGGGIVDAPEEVAKRLIERGYKPVPQKRRRAPAKGATKDQKAR